MKDIVIQNARETDYPKFKAIHERYTYIGAKAPREPIVNEEAFKEYANGGSLFMAYENGVVVGYAIVVGYEDGSCSIEEIFVDQIHQRKGYGKLLVEHIKEVAKSDGFKQIDIFSLSIETDHFWMMKCGFRPDERGYLVHKFK